MKKNAVTYHFNNFHFSIQAKMVQEHLKILLHLNAIIIHLSNSEDTHFTFSPNLSKNALFITIYNTVIAISKYNSFTVNSISLETFRTIYYKMKSQPFSIFLTLCCRRRKGSNISIPPSWTIHHTSMFPSVKRSWFVGNKSMFLATNKACWAAVVSRTVSARENKTFDQELLAFIPNVLFVFFYCCYWCLF